MQPQPQALGGCQCSLPLGDGYNLHCDKLCRFAEVEWLLADGHQTDLSRRRREPCIKIGTSAAPPALLHKWLSCRTHMADSSFLLFMSAAHTQSWGLPRKEGIGVSPPSPVALSSTRARLARPRWPCMEDQLAASEERQIVLSRLPLCM